MYWVRQLQSEADLGLQDDLISCFNNTFTTLSSKTRRMVSWTNKDTCNELY